MSLINPSYNTTSHRVFFKCFGVNRLNLRGLHFTEIAPVKYKIYWINSWACLDKVHLLTDTRFTPTLAN